MNTKATGFNFDKFSEEVTQAIREGKPLLGAEGAFTPLLKSLLEKALEGELTAHLGKENQAEAMQQKNRRNGKQAKTVRSSIGAFELETPRDRNGTFDPQVVKKRQTVLTHELDNKIIRLFGSGMSYSDISKNVKDIYGIEVSDSTIHSVTEQIVPLLNDWRNRTLEKTYTVVFLDAMYFKAREEGKVVTKVLYNILGVNIEGKKDILGFYIAESEGSHFWLSVLNDLKVRGVEDILIACIDGLKGFPEAISSTFPNTEIQLCIVHQIRNSLKYIGSSNQKEFLRDLKTIYQSSNKDTALQNLYLLDEKWGKKYPLAIKPWLTNWDNLSCYFKFSPDIRRLIYTTNPIEGFHRQVRKYTKTKGAFTSEMALLKLVYCAIQNIKEKWTMCLRNWAMTLSQLDIYFPGRLKLT
jgi:transposase-like protein